MTNNDILTGAIKSLGVMSENTITGRELRRFLNDIVRCKDCKHWLCTTNDAKKYLRDKLYLYARPGFLLCIW